MVKVGYIAQPRAVTCRVRLSTGIPEHVFTSTIKTIRLSANSKCVWKLQTLLMFTPPTNVYTAAWLVDRNGTEINPSQTS